MSSSTMRAPARAAGAAPAPAVLELRDVVKRYPGGVEALRGVSVAVRRGELVAITGPSGSGKSTLLHVVGTLERPTAGSVHIAGHDTSTLADPQLAALRARHVGFVFQQFFLVDGMTARDNVAAGLLYAGVPRAERAARAREALHRVGLGHRLDHRPGELSGGERQRVAIARALMQEPSLILADEFVSQLDPATTAETMAIMRRIADRGVALVMTTHELDVVECYADGVIVLANGEKVLDCPRAEVSAVDLGALVRA